MNKQEPAAVQWKRFLLYEQALIAKFGKEEYKNNVVFIIDNTPNSKCKDCFGRGYTGKDISVNRVCPCGCLHGFALKAIADLKEDELIMDFDGQISVVNEG